MAPSENEFDIPGLDMSSAKNFKFIIHIWKCYQIKTTVSDHLRPVKMSII